MKQRVTEELIDKKQFEQLVCLGLTDEELQQFFMVNSGKYYQWIKIVYHTRSPLSVIKKLRVQGKIDFMVKQRKLAEKNHTVSIWVGKNYYSQTDESLDDKTEQDFEDLNPLAKLLAIKEEDNNGNSND